MKTTVELTSWTHLHGFGSLRQLVRLTIDSSAGTTHLAVDEINPNSPPDRSLGTYRYDKGVGIRPAYFDLPFEEGKQILRMISTTVLSLVPAHGHDIDDGTSYTLSITAGTNTLYLGWRSLDGEWSALRPLVSELERYLNRLPKPEVPPDPGPPAWIAKLLNKHGQDGPVD